MQSSWKARLFFALVMLVVSMYVLVPSAIYFSLSPDQLKEVRQDKTAFLKYLPSWMAIDSHIVPGLDLQGGIHLVLGVDVNKALTDKTARVADRLSEFAESKKVAFKSINTVENDKDNKDSYQVVITFDKAEDQSAFDKDVLSQFQELVIVSDEGNKLTMALNPQYVSKLKIDALDQTIHTIRTRIDKMGVTEPSISKRGQNQIQVQLPGYDNPAEAKSLIGRTAQLEFQMLDDNTEFLAKLDNLPKEVELISSGYRKPDNKAGKDIFLTFPSAKLAAVQAYLKGKIPSANVVKYGPYGERFGDTKMRTFTLNKRVELTGDDLVDASVSMGSIERPQPAVSIRFSPTGARIFDELAARSYGERMAIVLEDRVDSAPILTEKRYGGQASISMGGARTQEEMQKDANQLSLVLKSGALPAPVTFKEERSVGPSLGADSIAHAKEAFMFGGILVALFMMLYYRKAGVISIVGVIFNIVFILATLSFLGATLTLPGIAGLLLTIGMAVDANVIINERIREELRDGKLPTSAVSSGYDAAFSAVVDANVTTFIAGFVLWIFGTGPVQNFATTLLIGTVFSVITAIFVTRIFFDITTSKKSKELSI